MSASDPLQASFDEFHRASAVLKMRLANAPHSEQTEIQRRKVEMLRVRLLDLVHRQLGFDLMPREPKRSNRVTPGQPEPGNITRVRHPRGEEYLGHASSNA
jgi:hypothetical protein